jgi:hypothetical protein
MKLKNVLPAALFFAASLPFSATPVGAAPVYCADASDNLELSDVTFRGADSDDCYGIVDGNDQTGLITANWTVNQENLFGGGWEEVVKDEDSGGPGETDFLDLHWTLTSDAPDPSGDWTLTVSDPTAPPSHFPVTLDLLVVIKAGSGPSGGGFIGYLFEAESFLVAGSDPGTYLVKILNRQDDPRDLSHISVYFRQGDDITVPEPGTLALFGIGLVGAFSRRRRTTT